MTDLFQNIPLLWQGRGISPLTGRWRQSPDCGSHRPPLQPLNNLSPFKHAFPLTDGMNFCWSLKTQRMDVEVHALKAAGDESPDFCDTEVKHFRLCILPPPAPLSLLCTGVWCCFLMSLGTSGAITTSPSVVSPPANAAKTHMYASTLWSVFIWPGFGAPCSSNLQGFVDLAAGQ